MPATVAECESNQTEWNTAIAVAGGGWAREDQGLRWSWQAHNRQLMLNFPQVIDAAAARRGVEFAHEQNASLVGAWLSPETDATPLEAVGFDRGWEPWWMAAPLDAIERPDDPRVALCADVPEYGPGGQRLLSLAHADPPRAWHAWTAVSLDERGASFPAMSPVSTTWTYGRTSTGGVSAARSCA